VVGGGNVAERKIKALCAAGASVTVVAPEVTETIKKCTEDGMVAFVERRFTAGDIKNKFLVIAATDDPIQNREVARLARTEQVLVNVVDSPEESDFIVPSSITRGDFIIAVSTSGKVPALAKRIREALERQFGPEFEPYVHLLEQARKKIYAQGTFSDAEKQQLIDRMLECDLLPLLKAARYSDADSLINTFLREHGI
jgi:precorrin-2 dehydrogenase/sirohydrochlorin ferrochelatase